MTEFVLIFIIEVSLFIRLSCDDLIDIERVLLRLVIALLHEEIGREAAVVQTASEEFVCQVGRSLPHVLISALGAEKVDDFLALALLEENFRVKASL